MIRQFSRKVEKQEIQGLKKKRSPSLRGGLGGNSLSSTHSDSLPDQGSSYKPGALEYLFDKEQGLSTSPEDFEGKVDKTNHYSKTKTNKRFDTS